MYAFIILNENIHDWGEIIEEDSDSINLHYFDIESVFEELYEFNIDNQINVSYKLNCIKRLIKFNSKEELNLYLNKINLLR